MYTLLFTLSIVACGESDSGSTVPARCRLLSFDLSDVDEQRPGQVPAVIL